jgi:DNA polymerase III epsilon subunit-like protein
MKKKLAQEAYISVDIEASGPIPSKYSMLSIGACLVGDHEKEFYQELKPLNSNFDPEALRVSSLSLNALQTHGATPTDAMNSFRDWVSDVCHGKTPVFVGFNAVFDWSFINWYFHEFLGSNPFGHGAIDIKSYYMGLWKTTWADTSSSRLNANFQPHQQKTHNALDDAKSQAEIFERLLKWNSDHTSKKC